MAGARVIRRRRNPINPIYHSHELPYGEWVPAHAVKFNDDGTVDVMTEGEHGRQRNIAGYKDALGHFHPIRWDPDYDPEELTVPEGLGATTHAGLPRRRRKPKARKRGRR